MNRYQKPEIYQPLALRYIMGSMSLATRQRFQILMKKHPFIEVTVNEYEKKFSLMMDGYSEVTPRPHLWKHINQAIHNELDQSTHFSKPLSKKAFSFFQWRYVLAGIFLLVASIGVFQLNDFMSVDWAKEPSSIITLIESDIVDNKSKVKVAFISATKINMELKIHFKKPLTVAKGKRLHLWCLPKNGGGAMDMGVLDNQAGLPIKLTYKEWKGLLDAASMVISIEPIDKEADKPVGAYRYQGDILFSS